MIQKQGGIVNCLLFCTIDELVFVGPVVGSLDSAILPQDFRMFIKLRRIVEVRLTGHILDVVHPPLVFLILELNGRHKSTHRTRYGQNCITNIFLYIFYFLALFTAREWRHGSLEGHQQLPNDILVTKTIHVQDPHLLDDGTLSGLSRPWFTKRLMRLRVVNQISISVPQKQVQSRGGMETCMAHGDIPRSNSLWVAR